MVKNKQMCLKQMQRCIVVKKYFGVRCTLSSAYTVYLIFLQKSIIFSPTLVSIFSALFLFSSFWPMPWIRALGGTIAGSHKSQYFWFSAEPHKFVYVQTALAHYPQPAARALSIHRAGQKDRSSGDKNVPFPLFFLTNVMFHRLVLLLYHLSWFQRDITLGPEQQDFAQLLEILSFSPNFLVHEMWYSYKAKTCMETKYWPHITLN